MSRIFWDTNLFIYLFEGRGLLFDRVVKLRGAMLERGDQLVTSALTLGEVLVKAVEHQDVELATKYEEAIAATSLLIPFDARAARVYATLRCERSIRPPDAIQLACAAAASVDLFITNDERLRVKHVDGIQFIVPLSRAPL
jgi:predicted nucleic acid-binding protein